MKSLKSLWIAIGITACASGYAYDGTATITSGGMSRTFTFHSPGVSPPPAGLPVMIVMHGDGGNGASVKGYTGMDAIADAQNFIAVYPDAVNGTWNRYVDNVPGDAGLGNAGAPDDVQFISDMIAYFCTTYHINSRKVYATGHSAGGFMAYNLGIQLNSKIAAIAPVAASLWGDNAFINNYFANSYTPIPVYHIHGDADATVNYPDPNNVADAWGEWPLSGFGNANCGNNTYGSSTTLVTNVKKLSFCSSGKEVTLIRIMGGGHGWPAVSGYNAASAIWSFCNSYSITAVSCAAIDQDGDGYDASVDCDDTNPAIHPNAVEIPGNGIDEDCDGMDLLPTSLITHDAVSAEVKIYPNPSMDAFTIQSENDIDSISVVDMTGKIIPVEILHDNTFQLNSGKGLYFATIRHSNGKITHVKLVLN